MAIEGKKIISRMTGATGYIDRIEKGKHYISFQSMNSIGIDLKGYEDKIVVDEETKNELDEIIQSFKVPSRKTNRSKVDNGKMEILPKSIDILDADGDKTDFEYIVDILNACFGAGVAGWQKATWPSGRDIAITDSQMTAFVWMPKFYRNRSLWKNSISRDREYIYEVADYDRNEDWTDGDEGNLEKKYRIVFVKEAPDTPYRFVGVFEDFKMEHLNHSYKRVSSKIKLIGDPVYRIELL